MGATTFLTIQAGSTADEAFVAARERALHEHGHGGSTGSIAEKHTFLLLDAQARPRAEALSRAQKLVREARFHDRDGPAGCISVEGGSFLFFGWARE